MWVGEVGVVVERIIQSENKIIKNQIFNLGNTNANKKKDIAEIIKNKFIPELDIKYQGQDQDLRSYRVDFSKIEKNLNFKLQKPLEQAIEELVFSVKNNLFKDLNNSKYKTKKMIPLSVPNLIGKELKYLKNV